MFDWVIHRPQKKNKVFEENLGWSKSSRLLQRIAFRVVKAHGYNRKAVVR